MPSRIDRSAHGLPASIANPAETHVFRLEGEYWTIAFEGVVLRLRDARGLQYLAYLLSRPSQRFPARELFQSVDPKHGEGVELDRGAPEHVEQVVDAPRDERARSAVSKRIKAALKKIHTLHPPLGRYLRATIKTGHVCSYVPDEAEPPQWKA